jgi:hypothetical protein
LQEDFQRVKLTDEIEFSKDDVTNLHKTAKTSLGSKM